MKWVLDTNVPKTANATNTPQASSECVRRCAQRLRELMAHHIVVLDDGYHILNEYRRQLDSRGQPGVGDMFFKWLLTHQRNPRHCRQVSVHPLLPGERRRYAEFPDDERLYGFDPADQIFVATALADGDHPSIVNAVDSDWMLFADVLLMHDIAIDMVCPEAIKGL
ncbi:MAG: hypothetical protein ABTQ73_02855 [Caldilineales bacterium]